MAPVNEQTYRALVWLTYRLAATFAVGVPLVLVAWSAWKREPMVLRLLKPRKMSSSNGSPAVVPLSRITRLGSRRLRSSSC